MHADYYPYKMGRCITKEELDVIPKQYYITSYNLINVSPNLEESIKENKWLLMYLMEEMHF